MSVLILVVYLTILIGAAYLGWRQTRTLDDHLIADRKMPVWLSSFTMAASVIGSGIVLGVSELAYKVGISAMLYPAILAVALAVSVLVASYRFRQSEAVTVSELLGRSYGRNVRTLVATVSAIKWLGPTAAQYLAVGAIIKSATGLDYTYSIIIGALIIIAYVVIGGTWAIAYTDTTQLIIVYIGLVLLFSSGFPEHGGVLTLAEELGPHYQGWTEVGTFRLTTWIGALMALSFADQVWLQRSASMKTPAAAVRAGLWGSLMIFPIGFLTVYAGLVAAKTMPGLDPRIAVPSLVFKTFEPTVAALFVAAIVAASMSSVDSWLHSSATLLVKDVYVDRINPGATEMKIRRAMNVATVALGAGAVALALIWKGGIINLVFLTMVWGSCVYIGPLLVLWYSPVRISSNKALGIMIATLAMGTALSFSPPYEISPLLISAIFGYALTFGAYLLARKNGNTDNGPDS